MKIIEAINQIDSFYPNSYTTGEKVAWLSDVDATIKNEIIDTHKDNEDISFSGYNDDTSLDTKLIADEPYSALYVAYLEAQMNYYDHEFTKYNNSMAKYNDLVSSFRNYYNSKHMPLTHSIKYL